MSEENKTKSPMALITEMANKHHDKIIGSSESLIDWAKDFLRKHITDDNPEIADDVKEVHLALRNMSPAAQSYADRGPGAPDKPETPGMVSAETPPKDAKGNRIDILRDRKEEEARERKGPDKNSIDEEDLLKWSKKKG